MNPSLSKSIFFFFFLVLGTFSDAFAQHLKNNSKQDSLINILRETDSLELKSKIHYKLYGMNRGYNPTLALKYLKDELALQEITNNKAKLALANSQIGWCYIAEVEEPEQAKVYLDRSYKLAVEIKDSVRAGVALTFLGFMNQRSSQYRTAMDYYFKSLQYKLAINQPNRTGFTYNLIGETYSLQEQYDKSLEFHFKALAERKKIQNGHVAHSYQNIGGVYSNMGDFDKSYDYYNKALEIRLREKNTKHLAICYNGLGKAQFGKKNLEQAIQFYEKSIVLADSLKATYIQTIGLLGLAESHLMDTNFEEAKTNLNKALANATKHGYRDHQKDSYKIFSQLYLEKNDPKNALLFYQKYVILKDSIINTQTSSQVAELEGIYNTEKKEKEIESLQQRQAAIDKQRILKNSVAYAILACSLVLLLFLAYHLKKRKTVFQQKLALKNKEYQISQLKLVTEEDKNKHYVNELNQFMQLMISKNNQIKKLQLDIENLPLKIEEAKIVQDKMMALYNSKILTDDDWKSFRVIFDHLHPSFIENISMEISKISAGEIKLCCLLKLNLSNFEVASILGISSESVRKNKYRLRQKHSFETDESFQRYIASL